MPNTTKLQYLSTIPSVTLFEKPMLNYLRRYLHLKRHRKISTERYLAFIPRANANGLVLTVHVDRLGLVRVGNIVTYSNYYGYDHYFREYKVKVAFGRRFIGQSVCAYNPMSGGITGEGTVVGCRLVKGRLDFKIEGIDWEQTTSPIPLAYKGGIYQRDEMLSGQIDNILGIFVSYYVLKSNSGFAVLYTTEEEIGISWRYVAEFLRKYGYKKAVTLDVTGHFKTSQCGSLQNQPVNKYHFLSFLQARSFIR